MLQGNMLLMRKLQGNLLHPENSEDSGDPKAGNRNWPHNFHMSSAVVSHMEQVYSIVRKIYDRSSTDNLDDLDVNTAISGTFMNTTLHAAVHLGHFFLRMYDLPRINSWSLWNSYSKWLDNWSRIKKKSEIWPRLITKSLRGQRHGYHVTKLLRVRMPVWEAWEMNWLKFGRTKLNGIWKIVI